MRMPLSLSRSAESALSATELSPSTPADVFRAVSMPGWRLPDSPLLHPAQPLSAGSAAAHHRTALAALQQRPEEALSVAVALPFCAARCLHCERPVHVAQPAELIDAYVSALVDEIDAVAALAGGGRDLLQLHLGGGTANELNESQLVRLVGGLQRHWRLPADAEVSAECDPRRVGEFQLRVLRGLGFRRLSFGLFELDRSVQQAIGRLHSAALLDDVCELARGCGIDYVDLELMVGLPCQTESGWRATLERVLRMAPDRITVLPYRHRPTLAPPQRALDRHALPSPAATDALAQLAAQTLCAAGYRWVGADRFVLDNDELSLALDASHLRCNLIGYTATAETAQLGFGAGAVGEIDGSVFWNETGLAAWSALLQRGGSAVSHAQLSDARTRRRRAAVEQLLCRLELPAALVDGGLESAYREVARREAEGFVQVLPDRIVVTALGRLHLASLCRDFDAACAADPGAAPWLC